MPASRSGVTRNRRRNVGAEWLYHGRERLPPTKDTPGPVPPPKPIDPDEQARDQATAVRRQLVFAWWLHPEVPAAQRRAAIFRLWNAADELALPSAARQQIEAYIRMHVRAADQFTVDEIDKFNAERGRPPVFNPYGTWVNESLR